MISFEISRHQCLSVPHLEARLHVWRDLPLGDDEDLAAAALAAAQRRGVREVEDAVLARRGVADLARHAGHEQLLGRGVQREHLVADPQLLDVVGVLLVEVPGQGVDEEGLGDPVVELATKVIRRFPKISQSRRWPLLFNTLCETFNQGKALAGKLAGTFFRD